MCSQGKMEHVSNIGAHFGAYTKAICTKCWEYNYQHCSSKTHDLDLVSLDFADHFNDFISNKVSARVMDHNL